MARNSTERLVVSTIWNREDPRFPGYRQHGQPTHQHLLQVWYYADFKSVVKRKNPRISAFQLFTKTVYILYKYIRVPGIYAEQYLYQLRAVIWPLRPLPAARAEGWKERFFNSTEGCPSRCVRVEVHERAGWLKFLRLGVPCVARIRRMSHQH